MKGQLNWYESRHFLTLNKIMYQSIFNELTLIQIIMIGVPFCQCETKYSKYVAIQNVYTVIYCAIDARVEVQLFVAVLSLLAYQTFMLLEKVLFPRTRGTIFSRRPSYLF